MISTFGEKTGLWRSSRFKIVEKKIVVLRVRKIYLVKIFYLRATRVKTVFFGAVFA